jgi:Contractile injection system tube protein
MERVTFLLEDTGARLVCMLNPETLTVRRQAGVQPRRSVNGVVTGKGLADNQLLYTGGGKTELDLELLFDIQLSGSSVMTEDVRGLTSPLWDLAENSAGGESFRHPPQVRFIWGKGWNIPGIVASVAERLEQFTPQGIPQRSWLRMQLIRTRESGRGRTPSPPPLHTLSLPTIGRDISAEELPEIEVRGGGGSSPSGPSAIGGGERLDDIAYRHYGDASYWRVLAAFNNLADPMQVPPGTLLRLPPLESLRGRP